MRLAKSLTDGRHLRDDLLAVAFARPIARAWQLVSKRSRRALLHGVVTLHAVWFSSHTSIVFYLLADFVIDEQRLALNFP
jgi:hypothetical protein